MKVQTLDNEKRIKDKWGDITVKENGGKTQLGIYIGVNTPLFQYVSLLIKMNNINFK